MRLAIALVGATLWASSSPAALIDLGDVTRDTQTGLEWLDLTQSLGISPYDLENGVGNDLLARGWRWATTAEVCALFASHALADPECGVANTIARQSSTGAVQALIDLLGDTGAVIEVKPQPPYDPTFEGSAGVFDGGDPASLGLAALGLGVGEFDGLEETQVFPAWIPPLQSDFTRGHFLVRAAPEPSFGITASAACLATTMLRSRRRLSPRA